MLKITNLVKYYGKHLVLDNVNLDVSFGDITGLIGINGAGKSTLIHIINGIKRSRSGNILINELEQNKKNKTKINNIIGYVPQNVCFYNDLTVYENILFMASVYNVPKEQIDYVISLCQLDEYKKMLASKLSGGYRQLLSVAMTLIHKPIFIILDEPTSAMDPLFRKRFWDVINSYKASNHNISILLTTHYLEELKYCDNFYILSKGKVGDKLSLKQYSKLSMAQLEEIFLSCYENN